MLSFPSKTGEIMGAKGARVAAPRPEGKGGDESGGFSRKRFFSSPIEHRRPTTSGPDRYSKRVATALSSPRCVLACKLCLSDKEKWKKLSTRECARLVKVLRAPRLEKTIDTSASVVGPTFFESSIVGSVKKGVGGAVIRESERALSVNRVTGNCARIIVVNRGNELFANAEGLVFWEMNSLA